MFSSWSNSIVYVCFSWVSLRKNGITEMALFLQAYNVLLTVSFVQVLPLPTKFFLELHQKKKKKKKMLMAFP